MIFSALTLHRATGLSESVCKVLVSKAGKG